ncbi:hypothetical protein BaRGS_00018843 [Batillaria attramentaria]|uniref:Uncharacterized protein n=1 Tax=Batillaria attramentaria TaxID=370345 RepID=A0ABD0KSW5_9CAEN
MLRLGCQCVFTAVQGELGTKGQFRVEERNAACIPCTPVEPNTTGDHNYTRDRQKKRRPATVASKQRPQPTILIIRQQHNPQSNSQKTICLQQNPHSNSQLTICLHNNSHK